MTCDDDTTLQAPPVAKPDRSTSTDLSRLYFLYVSAPTEDRRGELMKCCEHFLESA
jgi:hypothetical protein